jgi:hypothetical protein
MDNTNDIEEHMTDIEHRTSNLSFIIKDKNGNHSLREIVMLVCLFCVVISWIAQQFFQKIMPEYMFYAFVSLIGAGCFGYSLEKKSN